MRLKFAILFTSGGERFQNLSDNVSSNIFQINSNSKCITSCAIVNCQQAKVLPICTLFNLFRNVMNYSNL